MNNRNVDSCKKDVSDGNEDDDDEDDGKNTFYKIPTRTTTQGEIQRAEGTKTWKTAAHESKNAMFLLFVIFQSARCWGGSLCGECRNISR